MRQATTILTIETHGPGLVEFTDRVASWLTETDIQIGLVTLFCRHTSASLLIQENAAVEVRSDLTAWLDLVAPEGEHYAHNDEGPDDMPAHLKAALTGIDLTIPIAQGRLMLGTWQGVYLAEHRARPHRREVALHVIGD